MAQYENKNNGREANPMDLFIELFGEKSGEKSAPTSRERSVIDELEQHFAPFKDFFGEQIRGGRAEAEKDTTDTEDSPKTRDSDDEAQEPEEDSDSLIEAVDRHREAMAVGSEVLAEAINNLAEALRR